MKSIFLAEIFLTLTTVIDAQQTQFLTQSTMMKILAKKNMQTVEWESKNISVRLDYKTGEFISRLKNSDFINTAANPDAQTVENIDERELTLEGTFPIGDIIDQHQINQEYSIELQLKNSGLDLSQPVLFSLLVSRPESGNDNSYRIFTLHGVIYNDQVNLPALAGFENEVELWLIFTGFMNTR